MTRLLHGPWGLVLGPALSLIAALVLLLADSETGLLPLALLEEQVQSQRERVEELRGERSELVQQVRALRVDPFAIEAVAREQLGMARPGELIVLY
jgi:cell division protein FtsB